MLYRFDFISTFLIGFCLFIFGIKSAVENIQKLSNFEQAQATVIGFTPRHAGVGGKSSFSYGGFPKISFVYKRDSIFLTTYYYWELENLGTKTTVIFPAGKPEEADYKNFLWVYPCVYLLPSLIFLLIAFYLYAIHYNEKNNFAWRIILKIKQGFASKAFTLFFITFITVSVNWITVYLINKKINYPDAIKSWTPIIWLAAFAIFLV